MLNFKCIHRRKRHKHPDKKGNIYGNVTVTYVGWFLFGFIPLILADFFRGSDLTPSRDGKEGGWNGNAIHPMESGLVRCLRGLA